VKEENDTSARISRVAVLDEQILLSDPVFLEKLETLAKRGGLSQKQAFGQAQSCLDELAVRPQERYLKWSARLARFMYSRSYESELDVNTDQLEQLKALALKQPLVFLWSHKSHLDSFVFMRAMYDNDFRPQPLSFAGINMNFMGFGTLARRSGAIFVRRSFKDDDIYKLVFTHYIDYLVHERVPLSWSIEGTRSRTGKLMPPKLGLINWVIEAYRRSACEDALFVPVSISFDQIPEIDDYVSMQRGLPKRKESLKWFIDYTSGMKGNYGKIRVRFATPIALNAALTETSAVSTALLADSSRPERIQTQKLAFEVSCRIEHANPISSSDLVTLVLLGANSRALTESEIRSHIGEIVDLIESRSLPTAGDLHLERGEALGITLEMLVRTGLLKFHDQAREAVWSIAPGKQLAAAYYRNTIIHYFLSSALAELALASTADLQSAEAVKATSLEFRDLLKFEFFFKTKSEFLEDVEGYLGERYPTWKAPEASCPAIEMAAPLFGHSILRSFIEAYFVLSRALMSAGAPLLNNEDDKALAGRCLALGEEMLLHRQISSETALSQPLFANAIRLARHRGLLDGEPGDIEARHNQFAVEMDQALNSINRLQHLYDQQHQEPG